MTNQIRAIEINLTPQQRLAFAFRGFDEPEVKQVGRDFLAFTVKPAPVGFEWAEFLARDPNIAVEQLARLVARA